VLQFVPIAPCPVAGHHRIEDFYNINVRETEGQKYL